MPIAKVNFTKVNDASAGSGGNVDAWVTTQSSDVSTDAGDYGFTHAVGQNGFGHRITIDTSADTGTVYLDRTKCAWIYVDTGISLTELRSNKALVVSVLLEFDIPSTSPILNDGAWFNFGPIITNSTTLSSGATGGFGGLTGSSTGFFGRKFQAVSGIGKVGSVNGLTGTQYPLGGYNQNADTVKSIQLSSTGRVGDSSNFGFNGLDITYGIEVSGTFEHSTTDYVQTSDNMGGIGNLVVGIMFGQRIYDADIATDKTFDFDFKYLVERT